MHFSSIEFSVMFFVRIKFYTTISVMKQYLLIVVFAFLTVGSSFAQETQGFFLNDFEPKSIENPSFDEIDKPSKAPTATVNVNFTDVITPVSKYLFGNNANIYMSQMVDQPVLINNIKTLSPNLLRFPGGNLSSVYFWNAATKDDLPADVPEFLLDAAGVASDPYPYWYGGNTASWTMSLDNYYEMLEMTSSTGMITVNYPYAPLQ